jgi:fructoselysine-6-P-deglycase FrlB-like protein
MASLNTAFMRETAAAIEGSLDADRLDRFRALLDGPLAIVASGGSFTTALLWAHLHEAAGHPAWALTPFGFVQRRLPAGTRVLFLSAGGHHPDIVNAAAAAAERGYEIRAATCLAHSPLARQVAASMPADAIFAVGDLPRADGLIAVQALVAFSVLAARAYAGPGSWASCFDGDGIDPPARVPRFVVAFGAGAAEPAAVDFANKCQEAGLAPAWATDLRHFAHGQFMMLRAAADDVLLVSFATGPQRAYVERFAAALPPATPLRRIEVDTEGPAAALTLLARSMVSFERLVALGGGPPTLDILPAWGRALYELAP